MISTSLKRVLYVEDDEALGRLLQKRMQRHNLTTDISLTAEHALERLDADHYDLLLVDYNLPGMSGLELLEVLVQRPNAPPVIILTAGGDERVALAALEKGAADYAVKDTSQTYLDLLPAVMQAAYTKERLLRENERQRNELEAAIKKAEAASKAKSDFLATMSHEIRTPLNVVTGLAAILAKTNLNNEQKEIVHTLGTNADLLLKLINDLLDISRIEAGQIELEQTQFTIASILHDIQVMFTTPIQAKQLSFRLNDTTTGQSFVGDRTRVQQIVMNLVSNAIKFTMQGEIYVTAGFERQQDGKNLLVITVKDSGIGIPADKLDVIFDKFTQADGTITRRFGGSGLGLSITKSLTEVMNGHISVQSVFGKGATFTVKLDLPFTEAKADVAPSNVLSPAYPAAGDNSGNILLVEDYQPNIMVATMMLENLGFTVFAVQNGPDAIRMVEQQKQPFNAILMDVQMQEMDGLETTKRIRALESERGFRQTIIGVTAHALAGDRERCLAAGMDDYISKPINPDILASKLLQLTTKVA